MPGFSTASIRPLRMPFNHKEDIVRQPEQYPYPVKICRGLDYESVLPSHRSGVTNSWKADDVYESSFAFTTEIPPGKKSTDPCVGLLSEADLDQLSCGGKVTVRKLEKAANSSTCRPSLTPNTNTTTDTRIAKRSFRPGNRNKNPKRPTPDETPETAAACG